MNKSIKTDGELVDSILSSNKDDFRILVERYQQRIFSYLYRLLHQNRDGALDITQSVFLKVYQNLNTYDKKRPMQAWIYRIAHNEAANHLRSISRRRESLLDEGQWDNISAPNRSDPYDTAETQQWVLDALEQIDPKYREVLVLHYFEDKSYKEIAEILDSSTNTVGTLIRRAKKQMGNVLQSRLGQKEWLFQIVWFFFTIGLRATLQASS